MFDDRNDTRHVWQLAHHKLRVWQEVRVLNRLVHANRIDDAELRDQATRAVKSAGLNTCEGAARDGRAKTNHYKIAHGSAIEVVGCYELAADHGEHHDLDAITAQGARVAAMLSGLIRR